MQNGDKESEEMMKEILAEEEAEKSKAGVQPTVDPEPKDADPAEGEPAKSEPDPKAPVQEDQKTGEDVDGDDEEEGKDNGPDAPQRPTKYIPIQKFKKQKDNWELKEKEYLAQISDLKSRAHAGKDTTDEIKSIAEKYDVNSEFLEEVVKTIEQRTKLPNEVQKQLQDLEKLQAEKHQDMMFDRELDRLVKDYPEAKEAREQLKELAFSEGYEKTSLFEIYFRNLKKPDAPRKKSAESSRGGSNSGAIDFSQIDQNPDLLDGLSSDEFAKYSEWKGKNSKTHITRR